MCFAANAALTGPMPSAIAIIITETSLRKYVGKRFVFMAMAIIIRYATLPTIAEINPTERPPLQHMVSPMMTLAKPTTIVPEPAVTSA